MNMKKQGLPRWIFGLAALALILGMTAPAVTAQVVVSLDHNRNRLLDTLAQVKGASDRCTYWSTFTNVERGVFLTHTDMRGDRTLLQRRHRVAPHLLRGGQPAHLVLPQLRGGHS